jgi:hypothetical protein
MVRMESILAQVNLPTILALALWTLPWKAWALWLSARRGDIWWFLIMMFVSTLGLLEIIYIFFVAKQSDKHAAVAHPDDGPSDGGE